MADARDLSERRLASETVFKGVFLELRRDRARMPDGREAIREYVVHPGAAAMVPLFDDGTILIERQFRYPLGRSFVEIPAGKLDPGETSLQTARRELLEETGYRAREWALLTTIHPAIGFADEAIDIYLCRGLEPVGETALDDGEFVEIDRVSLEWLEAELRAGRLTDVKTQIAVHWLRDLYEQRVPWPRFEPAPRD